MDSFEFELSSPMTKEDWDKIADVELNKTQKIWFGTPSGKEVAFIPLSVIEDIRAEIDEQYDIVKRDNIYRAEGLEMADEIIKKHMSAE